ncbi:glycosyltransferase [Clostridium drakei]|uniref:Glycosyl transferase n=1 Tax=Clostridium drakei TaxID=332101 RepID=A0A2U8DLE7_9CLOT|nr:glycosyltransferase family 2 protein [Clostridium drakei]AWI03398.1 glycosyl transferase [Clostridium drakei]
MITISLCMIVKNESINLKNCLDSIKNLADEIIIVDTGSTDNTVEIAKDYSDKVFFFEWIDNFAAARNFSFSKASMDYILWLDADDILLPESSEKLYHLKHSLSPSIDAVSMQYNCDFDDYGNVALTVRRTRLVKRSKNYQWDGVVHEDLLIKSSVFYDSDIVVTHRKIKGTTNPDRNLKIYEKLLLSGKEFTLRDALHYAIELHHHKSYQKATEYYLKFLEMNDITADDCVYVCSKLADCYYQLGDRKKEREYIFRSFDYDSPRPEFCCRLGYAFLEKSQFSQAAFWYNLAIQLPKLNNNWVIQNQISSTWLPHIQLGLCYYEMGEYEKSYYHNKTALSYRPNDQDIINNMKLLEELLAKK